MNDELLHYSRPCFLGQAPVFDYRIALQLFAAEDEGRTEPPSERRRREEEEKGNVPKSQELPAAIVMLSGVVMIFIMGQHLFFKSGEIMRRYLSSVSTFSGFTDEAPRKLMEHTVKDLFSLLFPILGITFVAAIVGSVAQVGFMFAPKAINMDFKKIKPNFKKVLPTRQTMFNLAKSIAKVILIGWVTYLIISNDFLEMLLTGDMGLVQATRLIGISSFKIFLTVGILLFIISIGDFFYQKYEYEESLKMTPSEAKQEAKEQEGDRGILQRRRQLAREVANRGMMKKVPTADVVITNPTHYSIALAYNPAKNFAPMVVAKGVDEMALLIRRLAKKHGIPIVENRVQARLLYDEVEVDEEIPQKFFQAISMILARLDKFKREVA